MVLREAVVVVVVVDVSRVESGSGFWEKEMSPRLID